MIKFVYCLRKRADLTDEEFRNFWRDTHGPFIRSIAKTLGATENVVVQENLQAPRVGRALSIDRQKQMNATVQELHDFKIGAVLVDGFSEAHSLNGHSVIEMHLEITTLSLFPLLNLRGHHA